MNERTMTTKDPVTAADAGSGSSPQAGEAPVAAGRWRTLAPRLLRGLGAGVLIASLSVFLFQGWDDAGDLGRFALLLGQTTLLMAAGFASGQWLREPRGARIFVAIALVAVVANFAVLGGLLWPQFGPLGAFATLGEPALSALWVGGATIGGVLLLWPICRIGFTVLARRSARPLSWLLFANAAILLVPVRDALPVAALAVAATGATMWSSRRLLPRNPALRSPEGVFALTLTLVPIGVIVGRGIVFPTGGATLLAATGAAVLYVILREAALQCHEGHARMSLEATNAAVASLVGVGVTAVAVVNGLFVTAAYLPIASTVAGGLLLELSLRAREGAGGYRLAGISVIALAMAANALLFDGLALAALALVVGIAVAVHGFVERQAWLLAPAAIATLAGLGTLAGYAVDQVEIGAWGILALIGVTTVVAGSLIERFGVARWLAAWRANAADE